MQSSGVKVNLWIIREIASVIKIILFRNINSFLRSQVHVFVNNYI